MTVLLFVAGGLAAAMGTRLAAAAFIAAAVVGARDPSLAAISVWTAALAAGWVLLDRGSPRRVAAPALGAAAVLAAAGAPNGAVVLGLWVVGTGAAVMTRGRDVHGRRWALMLCASDVLVALALASTAGRDFAGWPGTLRLPGVAALIAAAIVRAPLAGGADDHSSYPALLLVRTQTFVLIAFAASAAHRPVLEGIVVAGAVGFALSTTARRRAVVDATQELSLVALAVATTRLGWVPGNWTWGALGAGTLIHHLRSTLGRRPNGPFADALERSAGIGLPFLPVLVAQLEGAFRVRGWLSAVVLFGVLGGMAGRTLIPPAPMRRGVPELDPIRGAGVLLAASAASAWAPLMELPRTLGGAAIGWPAPWAIALVLAVALVASQRDVVGTRAPEPVRASWQRVLARTGALDRIANETTLWVALAVLALAALALWLVGVGRGFL